VFIYIEPESNLRFVFVCEDNSEKLKLELHGSCLSMVNDFKKRGLLEAIELCEILSHSFVRVDMQEVQNVLIANHLVEQYSVYNLPVIYPDELLPSHVRALQEFEKLYHQYMASPRKEGLMLKKVFALETYALLGVDEYYVVMATISHNRTEKDTFEIL
jgi:hypothetical protein